MAANFDVPLDLSMRRNNHNEGTVNPPNRNRPQSVPFPPAPLPHNMGAPRPTSLESYRWQPTPGQFFNAENVLNLDSQPKPLPVSLTSGSGNQNNNNYCNNQNYNQTTNPGNMNINGNNGPHAFRPPWINPYDNYPYQSNLNSYHLLPGGQMLMSPLFPFQPQPNQIPNPSPAYHNNYGNGNNPYEQRSYRPEQPRPSAFHPPPTHSSYNNNWARSNSAFSREETQGNNNNNGLGRETPEVISVVFSGSIQILNDAGNENDNENENANANDDVRDEGPPVLTPHAPVGIPGPSTNFDDHTSESPPLLSPQVSLPGSPSNYPQPKTQDIRSGATPKRKENVAVASGAGTSSRGVSRPAGSGRCPSPTEGTVKEPTDKIRVLQFGVSKKTGKPVPSNFEETVSEKCGRSGEKSLKNSGKGGVKASASVGIPSTRVTRGNKGPTLKTATSQKSPVPVHKPYGPTSRVQQSQRQMELRHDASSRVAGPRKGSNKQVKWLLVDPKTEENEMDTLVAEFDV